MMAVVQVVTAVEQTAGINNDDRQANSIHLMKRNLMRMSVLTAALVVSASCLKEPGMDAPVVEYDRVVLSVDPFSFEGDVATKLTPSISAAGVDYLWAQGDTVGIYPDAGSQLVFPVVDYGAKTTSFDGGAWRLSSDHIYYAYVPFVPDIRLDKGAVPVSFRGQHQSADADATGLRDYVFMSASGAAPVGKDLMFQFKRLGCLLWISLDINFDLSDKIKSLSIYPEDGSLLPVDGEFDLTTTTSDAAPDLAITRYEDSWTLDLDDMWAYTLNKYSKEGYDNAPLTCYMMVPPVDLTGKTLKFELKYYSDYEGVIRTAIFTAPGKNLRKSGATKFTPARMEDIVSFEDKNVHDLCVAQWDTNGNGELDYSEAAAVTEIPDYMFANTSIEWFDELYHFTSLTRIGDGAFKNCTSLIGMSFLFQNAVSIGDEAFSGCSSLRTLGGYRELFSHIGKDAFKGCTYLFSEGQIPALTEDVDEIPEGAFQGCKYLSSNFFDIPNTVRYIGSHAFDGCIRLTSITLPDDVKVGPYGVFANTGLTSISIPSSWTEIGDDFFNGCTRLASVSVPEGVVRIGDRAFEGCTGLSSVSLPQSLLTIGEGCFRNCSSLGSVVIPSRITHLSYGTFAGCSSLSGVTLPEGLVSISSRGEGAFANCSSLESIALPSTLSSVGEYTFFGSGLRSIVLPDNVRYLGKAAFEGCNSLTECTLSQNLASLAEGVFTHTGLTTLTIPSEVAVIKSDLTRAHIEELYLMPTTPPSIPSAEVIPDGCVIYVPESSVNTYKSAPFWSDHADQIRSVPGGGAGGDTGGSDNWT